MIFRVLTLLLGFTVPALGAWHSVTQISAGSAAVSLSIDGTATPDVQGGSTTGSTVTLTTTKSNDIILFAVQAFVTGQGSASITMSDVAGLTWTKRSHVTFNPGAFTEEWWALSASPLTGDVITYTLPGASTFYSAMAVGINGSKTSAPYDVNGAIPNLNNSNTDVVVTTTAANTIALGIYAQNSAPQISAGSGFTAIAGANSYIGVIYKIVSAAQSSLDMLMVTGAGTNNGSIGDAIVRGP